MDTGTTGERRCGGCARSIGRVAGFHFQATGGSIDKCFSCAVRHGPMLKRSVLIALIVGSLLVLINQGDLLLRGQWNPALAWKIPLTYLVPFVVATCGALTNSRLQ